MRRGDVARADAVALDVVLAVLGADVAGQHLQAALRRGISGHRLAAKFAHHGADVDNLAVTLLNHRRNDRLGDDERRIQVNINHLTELFGGHFAHRNALDDARVVDKDVNHADFFLNLGDERVDGGFIGHVADIAVRLDALFGIGSNALIHQFLLNVVEDDGRAGVAHGAGDGEADTVGRTGDEGDFALQREHIAHGKSPFNYRG